MSTKKYLDLDGLSRVWDKIGDKFVTSTYATSNLSKKISSIQSFYGTSSTSSTTPTRWTLPDEYQEVEYIASDTTNKPYIDSGVVCTDITKIECKFATLSMGSSQYITGARGQAIYIAITGSGSTTVYNATYNGTQVVSDITRANEVVVDSSVTLGEIDGNSKRTATFYCSDGTNTFTQTSSPISVIPSSATATLCLFGFHSTNNSPSRIYREKVYTDNGLVRDFIPCYKKATSEMGMYDLVTNQFYGTASNSRPFSLKGSNVTYAPQLTDVETYLWGYDLITYTDGTTQKSPYYIVAQKSSGGSGTTDYTDLSNKPQINSVTLTGNKSLSDLGIAAANGVINATDLTVTNGAVNLVDYVNTPGIYKVPSNCWIYTDSASSTTNRIYAETGDVVKIDPQIDAGDGEEFVEFDSFFTIFGSTIFAGSMITADNTTWTSTVVSYEHQGNKVTTVSSSSRNTQYPSAKAVYDYAAQKSIYADNALNLGRKSNTTTGSYSAALGKNNTVSGMYTASVGSGNTVSGACAFGEGEVTTASGEASHAGGMDTTASGDMSYAFGDGAEATGETSTAIGQYTIAQKPWQTALGKYNIADTDTTGKYAAIIGNGVGYGTNARSNALTVGWDGEVWAAGDIYVGSTGGLNKDAGSKKLATEDYVDSLVLDGAQKVLLYDGKSNNTAILTGVTEALSDSIFNYDLLVIGFNCLVGSTRVMELTMPIYPKSSLITFCDSTGTGATGAYHIVNANTGFASGNAYRVMFGFTDATHIRNIISNQVGWSSPGICYVIGYKFSALPDGYMQEPSSEGTSGQVLTTDGNGGRTWTTVQGGSGNYASKDIYGDTAVNFGRKENTTTGTQSVALGYNVTAKGGYSFATGYNTTTSNPYAFAEGFYTEAYGQASHVEGSYTTARRKSQHVEGEYNILDTGGSSYSDRGAYLHIAGNGTGTSALSNAHTLDWSGNAWFAGDVYTGSTSGTNKDAGSKKLATEEYLDNKITYGTTDLTAGTSALTTGTLYFVYE